MAAYAALVSLMNIIDQIQNHPHPPISLDKTQVETLTEKVTFLQEFLEDYDSHVNYSKEADELKSRIADAAYAAEDVIESCIVDRIRATHSKQTTSVVSSGNREKITTHSDFRILPHQSTTRDEKISFLNLFKCFRGPRKAATDYKDEDMDTSSIDLYEALQKVIADMDSIKEEAMEIKVTMGQLRYSTMPPGTLGSSSNVQNTMVGFDDALLEIMDKLTGGQPDRQIIPIVGMGGMGKTTLSRNIYAKPLIKDHFDICAWTTISQEYDARELFTEILSQQNIQARGDLNENELGEMLYKHLWGRRYLVVFDDMWSIEVWDKVMRFLPKNTNGSRIIITTRLSYLAFQLTDSFAFKMKFLDEDKSWVLFCKTVFGKQGCPLELEEIGRKIVENCRGLPLSIVVAGGLLAKFTHSLEHWKNIAGNLNSLVNSEDDEHCLKILYMSYKHLPVHLKPCFLYMGVFSEDHKIGVNMLIRSWVAEGFLKPLTGKSLEEVAKEYLDELINVNLVNVETRLGEIKYCSIHDLLRDLCLREAEKEGFYMYVTGLPSFNGTNAQRRIVIHGRRLEKEVANRLKSMSLARSLIYDRQIDIQLLKSKLLRMVHGFPEYRPDYYCSLESILQFVNLRYFVINSWDRKFPWTINLLWNLQTLVVDEIREFAAPSEIWNMSQLRHVKFDGGLYLPDAPSCGIDKQDDIVLNNLQSLTTIINFKCGEEVIKRIPNIKKLRIEYNIPSEEPCSQYCLNNLDRLHKLESFRYSPGLISPRTDLLQNLSFPHSLKKLHLEGAFKVLDDILIRIGSIPLLEVLILRFISLRECVWETVEGHFCRLKVLMMVGWKKIEYWNTESTHFPCLEHLDLQGLFELKELPLSFAEIPTLQSISLLNCRSSVVLSAKKILEEQEDLFGEVTLQVRVAPWSEEDRERFKSLANSNFQVI